MWTVFIGGSVVLGLLAVPTPSVEALVGFTKRWMTPQSEFQEASFYPIKQCVPSHLNLLANHIHWKKHMHQWYTDIHVLRIYSQSYECMNFYKPIKWNIFLTSSPHNLYVNFYFAKDSQDGLRLTHQADINYMGVTQIHIVRSVEEVSATADIVSSANVKIILCGFRKYIKYSI